MKAIIIHTNEDKVDAILEILNTSIKYIDGLYVNITITDSDKILINDDKNEDKKNIFIKKLLENLNSTGKKYKNSSDFFDTFTKLVINKVISIKILEDIVHGDYDKQLFANNCLFIKLFASLALYILKSKEDS